MNPIFISCFIAALGLAACNHVNQTANASAAGNTDSAAGQTFVPNHAASAHNNGMNATDVSQEPIGGDFTLTDGQGRPFSLSSLKGKVVILSFGFTNCPDVCPTQLLVYHEAIAQLGEEGKDVEVVFVSIDPERDTPDLVGRYVAQFSPKFIGLTDEPSGGALTSVKQQYRIAAEKTEIKSDKLYAVEHTSGAYLIDKAGNVTHFAPYGIEAPQLAEDLKKLLAK